MIEHTCAFVTPSSRVIENNSGELEGSGSYIMPFCNNASVDGRYVKVLHADAGSDGRTFQRYYWRPVSSMREFH
jgi:hypothetical protein